MNRRELFMGLLGGVLASFIPKPKSILVLTYRLDGEVTGKFGFDVPIPVWDRPSK